MENLSLEEELRLPRLGNHALCWRKEAFPHSTSNRLKYSTIHTSLNTSTHPKDAQTLEKTQSDHQRPLDILRERHGGTLLYNYIINIGDPTQTPTTGENRHSNSTHGHTQGRYRQII